MHDLTYKLETFTSVQSIIASNENTRERKKSFLVRSIFPITGNNQLVAILSQLVVYIIDIKGTSHPAKCYRLFGAQYLYSTFTNG